MEPTVNPILQTPPAITPTTIDITITHSNGVVSKHQYHIPNEASVELVCVNNQKTIVYPLVQIQNYPMFGQSSFLSHHTRPHSTIHVVHCPSSPRFNAKSLSEALSDSSIPVASENNQRNVSPPPGFSMVPMHLPTTEEVMKAPPGFPHRGHHDVKVTDVSNNFQGIGRPSTSVRKRGRAPFTGPCPLKKKGGPYTCKRCGEIFQISQTLAIHMRAHYLQEETMVEKEFRREQRIQRKIMKEKLKAARMSEGPTIVPRSSEGTKEVGAVNLTVESRRESASKLNNALDLGNKIKGT